MSGTKASYNSRFLALTILKCNNETSSVECASEEEFKQYLKNHTLSLITAYNYIDYDEVEAFKGPMKHTMQWVDIK